KGPAYGVVCFDLSPAVVSKGADAVYEAMKTALPQAGLGEGAKVLSEKKITLGDLVGRDWTIDCPKKGSKARAYHFLAGSRLYQVAASGITTPAHEEDAKKFVESFRILAPAAAPPTVEQPKPSTPPMDVKGGAPGPLPIQPPKGPRQPGGN